MLQRLENSNILDICPLTAMQEGIYFHFLYERNSPSFFVQLSYRMEGHVDMEIMRESLSILHERHEVLRTVFNHEKAGKPLQVILKEGGVDYKFCDFSEFEAKGAQAELEAFKSKDKQTLFDLNRDVLMRTTLIKLGEGRYELVWSHHHILMDGWCSNIIISEFNSIYQSLLAGDKIVLPKVKPFRTYIQWLGNQEEGSSLKHWAKYLKGYSGLATLPRYTEKGLAESYDNKQLPLILDSATMTGLKDISKKCQVTLTHIVQAVWGIVLGRYKGEQDAVFGMVISGRPPSFEGIESMVGLFINTIPVRIEFKNMPFSSLLAKLRQESLLNDKYSYSSLAEIQANLQLEEELLDHALVVENFPDQDNIDTFTSQYETSASDLQAIESTVFEQSNYDLDVRVGFGQGQGAISFKYNGNVYQQKQMEQIRTYVQEVIAQVIDNVHISCEQLLTVTPSELSLLEHYNNTDTKFPDQKTMVSILREVTEKHSDKPAIVFGQHQLTYGQLNKNSNKLARLMMHNKVGQEAIVGVLMERSPFMVEGIVAAWKAGAAYLPLDTEHPIDRLGWVIQNSEMTFLVTDAVNIKNAQQLQWMCPKLEVIYCSDSAEIYALPEQSNESMKRELWEYVATTSTDDITGGGWFNSYTGQAFSRLEMDEYVENTRNKVLPYLSKETKVLEVGCASGLTMFDLAPHVDRYVGIDLSSGILAKNKEVIQEKGYKNIELHHLYAHEIDFIGEGGFDVIIINSVVQNFHGLNYLRTVLGKCIEALNDKGLIFLGDVMDLGQKDLFMESLRGFADKNEVDDFKTKLDWSDELFISRDFFNDLKAYFGEITEVSISDKVHTVSNELTRYRYDICLSIDKSAEASSIIPAKKQFDSSALLDVGVDETIDYSSPKGLAYVIYTSGSTGDPKGAMVEHIGMLNHLYSKVNDFKINESSRVLQNARQTFDISVWQFFSALVKGGTTFVYTIEHALSLSRFLDSLKEDKITVAEVVPSYLDVLLEECEDSSFSLPDLQYMIATGEALHRELVNRWFKLFPAISMGNAYGPTEASDDITHLIITEPVQTSMVPLGQPIQNMRLWVLDDKLQVCAPGVKGEICVIGVGVGRGYLKNPDKTSGVFIDNPINNDFPDYKMYRTGDIGYWLPEGSLVFIGRKDHQVKVRGYRIELGEIEIKILGIPGVRNTVVVDRADEDGQKYLAAYITSDGETLSVDFVKKQLLNKLPEYMVPEHFLFMDALPLTSNGKIDRKSLPEPTSIQAENEKEDLTTETEKSVALIWEQILQRDINSLSDNFFKLGGHSLKATRLASSLRKGLGVNIELRDIFEQPTLKGMARKIDLLQDHFVEERILPVEPQEYYPVSHAQRRMWLLSQFSDASVAYNVFNAWTITGGFKQSLFHQAVEQLLERHEILRTTFVSKSSEPVQVVHSAKKFTDSVYQFIELEDTVDFDQEIQRVTESEGDIPFELEKGPLLKFVVLKGKGDQYFCLLKIHHIICDGWSMQLLFNELMDHYTTWVSGKKSTYEPLPFQYKDFSVFQQKRLETDAYNKDKEYWHNALKAPLEVLRLPSYGSRPEIQTFKGKNFSYQFSRSTYTNLTTLANKRETSLFMMLVAVVDTLFYRYSGQKDIVFGTSVAGRQQSELEMQIGFYVNTVALRSKIEDKQTFEGLLDQVKEMILGAFEHQDYPFDVLVDEISSERDLSRSAIFDVLVELQNYQHDLSKGDLSEDQSDLTITPYARPKTKSIFDLNLEFREHQEDLFLTVNYNTDLYSGKQIESLCSHMESLAKRVTDNPRLDLDAYDFLSQNDKSELLSFNKKVQKTREIAPISKLVAKQAELSPNSIAVKDDTEHRTYAQLLQNASQTATLIDHLNTKGDVVGLLLDNSCHAIETILGVWKTGKCYISLPTFTSEDELLNLTKDAGLEVLIVAEKYIHQANTLQWACKSLQTILCIDAFNIYEIEEPTAESMNREMWELVGTQAGNDIVGGGWIDSYTGDPISREEMDEYAQNTYIKLQEYLTPATRILEIGCASGITMFCLAPHVKSYFGTDMSATILERNAATIKEGDFSNIQQACLYAHEIDQVEEDDFNVIILNSVIQNFNGVNYLRSVLNQCIDKIKDCGVIYIGDIMDVESKEALLKDIREYRIQNELPEGMGFDDHQFYARCFFDDLMANMEHVTNVTHSGKKGEIQNELTKFRFDTIIHINKTEKKAQREPSKLQLDKSVFEDPKFSGIEYGDKSKNQGVAYVAYSDNPLVKGIKVTHLSALNRVQEQIGILKPDASTSVLQNVANCFEGSLWQMFAPLMVGGTCYPVSTKDFSDEASLVKKIVDENIRIAEFDPEYFSRMINAFGNETSLKKVVLSGTNFRSILPHKWVEKFPDTAVVNMHAIPEVGPMSHRVIDAQNKLDVMGTTPEGLDVYVINEYMNLCPIGVIGQICIAGQSVAEGYMSSVKSDVGFFNNPFGTKEKEVFFKSGNLGRWLPNGALDILGTDAQIVSFSGYHVELFRIENALLLTPGIRFAVVKYYGHNQLVAFLCVEGEIPSEEEIQQELRAVLPGHMIPNMIQIRDSFPILPDGSIDDAELEVEMQVSRIQAKPEMPESFLEQKLAKVWEEVLGKKSIAVYDNFFELGGHSLKATRVITRIEKELQVKLNLTEIFLHPTLASLASVVSKARRTGFATIDKAPNQADYPLSHSQQRLWVLDQLDAGLTAYNMPSSYMLIGKLDRRALAKSFDLLVQRHEILRTSFSLKEGEPRQVIHSFEDTKFQMETINLENEKDAEERAQMICNEESTFHFDLKECGQLRVKMLIISENKCVLTFNIHHIISDGWSSDVLIKDLMGNYDHLVKNGGWKPEPLKIQYKDYAIWQKQEIEKEGAASKIYWIDKFKGNVPVLEMPTDYPRPKVQDYSGDAQRFVLDEELASALRDLSRNEGTSVYILLVSLVKLFLYRYTGQKDIIVGTPVSGRDHADLDNQIGFYVNTLALRTNINSEWSFTSFLNQVKTEVLESFEHQFYPFDLLVDELQLPRDLGSTPLFNTMVTYWKHESVETKSLGDLRVEPFNMQNTASKLDMTFHFVDAGKALGVNIEYAKSLFSEARLVQMESYFKTLVKDIVNATDKPVAKMSLLTNEQIKVETALIRPVSINRNETSLIHSIVEEYASTNPNSLAIIDQGLEISYGELNQRANQLSNYLLARKVNENDLIGIAIGSSHHAMVSLLAVLKAGATAIFIDQSDSNFENEAPVNLQLLLVLNEKDAGLAEGRSSETVVLGGLDLPSYGDDNPNRNIGLDHNALVVWTSGFSDLPKPVCSTHKNLMTAFAEVNHPFQATNEERWVLTNPLTSSAGIQEFLLPLLTGGMILIPEIEQLKRPDLLIDALVAYEISVLWQSPIQLYTLMREVQLRQELPHLRLKHLLVAGTNPNHEHLKWWRENYSAVQTINVYVVAESWIVAFKLLDNDNCDQTQNNIGLPVPTSGICILDKDLNIIEQGMVGELAIVGDTVASGYHNNPELSTKAFVEDLNGRGQLMFLTGDLGRRLPNGEVVLIGRQSTVPAIGGKMIEPASIEYALVKAGASQAIVSRLIEKESNSKFPMAYLTGVSNTDLESFKHQLKTFVPENQFPSQFVLMDDVPVTSNGKVDVQRLPKPVDNQDISSAIVSEELEAKILLMWKDELKVPELAPADNFFEMGGHSLKAVRIISSLTKEFKIELTLRDFFLNPTVEEIGRLIVDRSEKQDINPILPVPQSEHYAVSNAQKRIWVLCQFEQASLAYNMPYPMFVHGDLDGEAFRKSLYTIIERHESLRTRFEMISEELRQFIVPSVDPIFSVHDLREMEDPSAVSEAMIREESQRIFDLRNGPLISVFLARIEDEKHLLMINLHHIIGDGWSMEIFGNELFTLYNCYSKGKESPLPPLTVQYKDYSEWQQAELSGSSLTRHQEYWHNKLIEPLPVLELPSYYERPKVLTYSGKTIDYKFGARFFDRLTKFGNSRGASSFIVLLSLVKTLFHRYTDQKDIVLGISSAGRSQKELEGQIGFYINTLAIRSSIQSDQSYFDLLETVRDNVLEAMDHQIYPFDRLVDELNLTRSTDRSAIFDVLVEFQNFENDISRVADPGDLSDLSLEAYPMESQTSLVDINIFFAVKNGELICNLNYNTDIYEEAQIKAMARHLENLGDSIFASPGKSLIEFQYLETEEKQLLESFNKTHRSFDRENAITAIIAQHQLEAPNKIALTDESGSITYDQLVASSQKIATLLNEISPETGIIGVLMDRSNHMAESILGTWYAGHAYLPLDIESPVHRLRKIVLDSSISTLLISKKYLTIANDLQWSCPNLNNIVCLDTDNIHSVEEEEKESMNKEMWENVGDRAEDDIEGGGWIDSYTGQPFSREEMDEYAENAIHKLDPYLTSKSRVLEIGCASGITMFRAAPKVAFYKGTDLSETIIEKNKSIAEESGLQNVSLQPLYAHEIDKIEESDFDVIIINSVLQNFNGLNYFRKVLELCMNKLSSKGMIFLGDVMDIDKRDDLLKDLQSFKASNANESFKTVVDFQDHQFYAQNFFSDLKAEYKFISDVEHSEKEGSIKNELTRFRYDTIVHVDKTRDLTDVVATKRQLDRRDLPNAQNLEHIDLAKGDALAYVIYTSGSTGNPKGAMVEHQGMLNHLYSKVETFDIDSSSKILQNANATFDISVWQFFAALLTGGTTVVYPKSIALDAQYFWHRLIYDEITIAEVVPSYLDVLLEEKKDGLEIKSLKYLLVTGEMLPSDIVSRWFQHFPEIPLANAYGPTEASDDITHYVMEEDPKSLRVSLGQPIRNMKIYVVDSQLGICPVGVKGEICVAGIGVGRGYLNNEERTRLAFISNPFSEDADYLKMYRTGDVGRWLPNGTLEYYGRRDQQVKIRGHRIELGEIENQILGLGSVQLAAVLDQEDENGDKYLAAYVSLNQKNLDDKALKSELASILPEYLIPQRMTVLEEMPLTDNGKINRKALAAIRTEASTSNYQEPRNGVEEKLIAIWEEILNRRPIGIHDDFFELGGHSLKATRLVSRIYSDLQVKVEFRSIFSQPTVAQLANVIEASSVSIYDKIVKAPVQAFYDLSHAQKRLWFLSQFEEASLGYNLDWAYRFEGDFDQNAWNQAYQSLIERHESLRTIFVDVNGEPKQLVLPVNPNVFFIEFIDLQGQINVSEKVSEYVNNEVNKSFDLSHGPLIRSKIIKGGENIHYFLLTIHHIAADGWSLQILVSELLQLYNSYKKGMPNILPALNIQYKDYAEWQNQQLSEKHQNKLKEYWHEKLQGELPILDLSSSITRPAVQTFNGNQIYFVFPPKVLSQLQNIVGLSQSSLFTVIIAVLKTMFFKLTDQTDIILGTSASGRLRKELEDQIGLYLNTLILRTEFDRTGSFQDVLDDVKTTVIDAYDNQEYPFDKLVEELAVKRDLSRSPIFDVLVLLQNIDLNNDAKDDQLTGLKIEQLEAETKASQGDLLFNFTERSEALHLSLLYNTDVFTEEEVTRFITYFESIVSTVAENNNILLQELSLVTEEDLSMLEKFYGPAEELPSKLVHELFVENAAHFPDQIAVEDSYGKATYQEIDKITNQLSHRLNAIPTGKEVDKTVAVILPRGVSFAKVVLGVWKAGMAYIPIDAQWPKDRISTILDEAKPLAIIYDGLEYPDHGHLKQAENTSVLLSLEELFESSKLLSTSELGVLASPESLAYIIYTSGSTGKPKGAMIQHDGMLNHMMSKVSLLQLGKDARVLQNANATFDISVWQFFIALLKGGTTVVYFNDLVLDSVQFLDRLKTDEVSIAEVVPSYLNALLNERASDVILLPALKYMLVTGESLSGELTERWFKLYPEIPLINAYGPTEASDDITHHLMVQAPGTPKVSLGRTIQNMRIYIVDRDLQLCPVGVKGEICVSGIGVGRGYVQDTKKTNEAFINNPFGSDTHRKLYRTGDIGKWSTDGTLEFYGRKDYQVKIWGHRIELGEIENAILKLNHVASCAVKDFNDDHGNAYLVAYVTPQKQIDLTVGYIQEALQGALPVYMMPSIIEVLNEMPLTANGKVDRKRLFKPSYQGEEANFEDPQTEVHHVMVSIWKEVLERDAIGITDNFFVIGGQSLKAAQVISHVYKRLGTKIDLRAFFLHPTIKELALHIEADASEKYLDIKPVAKADYYPLSFGQKRLWVLSQNEEQSVAYNLSDVYKVSGALNIEALEKAFEAVLERHEILRTAFLISDGDLYQEIKHVNESGFILETEYVEDNVDSQEVLIANETSKIFDLGSQVPIRAKLIVLGENECLLVITIHHIATDGWSFNVFIHDLLHFYRGFDGMETVELEPLPIQYKDFASWQESLLKGTLGQTQRDFWMNQFKTLPSKLRLPYDQAVTQARHFDGAHINYELDTVTVANIQTLQQQEEVTGFIFQAAITSALLHKICGQNDIVFGVPSFGREHPDLEKLIGFFVNTMVLRIQIEEADTFRDVLHKTSAAYKNLISFQNYPFDALINDLGLSGEENPLFNVMLVPDNVDISIQANPGKSETTSKKASDLKVEPIDVEMNKTQMDLSFHYYENQEMIHGSIHYRSALFDNGTISLMKDKLTRLIELVVEDPKKALNLINVDTRLDKTFGTLDSVDLDF